MKSFITGSHAYGRPHVTSDVDLVVFMEPGEASGLLKLMCGMETHDESGYPLKQFKVGKLNVLICRTQAEYNAWQCGTDALKSRAPVTRDEAVEVFKSMRRAFGVDCG